MEPDLIRSEKTPSTKQRVQYVNLPDNLRCVQCRQDLVEPVQTPCGHLACAVCTDSLKARGRCPSEDHDEEDCTEIKPDTVFNKDKSALRELRKLMVFCPFREFGCNKTLPFKEIDNHTDRCVHKRVSCPYKNNGCAAEEKESNLQEHINRCPHKPFTCPDCEEQVSPRNKEAHKIECKQAPVPCPNECGATVKKEELDCHLKDECTKATVPCPLRSLGCPDHVLRDELADHFQKENHTHWKKSAQKSIMLEIKCTSLENLLMESTEKLNCDINQLKMESQQKSKIIHQQGELLAKERESNDQLQQKLSENEQKSRLLAEELKKAVATISDLSSRLKLLERNNALPTDTVLKQVHLCGEQLHLLDLRLQCQETTSYNGTLVWRIGDYKRRKQDAKTGTTLSLYSQPFYTSRDGYKMCARVYLNGDGLGKNTHMSLFFVVMKGEYDALLRWPFQQRVTMRLLHQDGGQDVWDTFDPDVTSSSFQRPRREMNVASGCPMFVEQAKVEGPDKYLVDDTLFLKIEVLTNNCHVDGKSRR